jgi:hypothetical protein
MLCPYFAETKIKLSSKHTIADECKICPLREEGGDCIKDIHEEASEMAEQRTSEIWRKFYEKKGG